MLIEWIINYLVDSLAMFDTGVSQIKKFGNLPTKDAGPQILTVLRSPHCPVPICVWQAKYRCQCLIKISERHREHMTNSQYVNVSVLEFREESQ